MADNNKYSKEFRDNMGQFGQRTSDELREITAKGGKKSGETRRRMRDIKADLKLIMESDLLPSMADVHKQMNLPADTGDNHMGIAMALFKEAVKGNVKAIELSLKILGEYEDSLNLKQTYDFDKKFIIDGFGDREGNIEAGAEP